MGEESDDAGTGLAATGQVMVVEFGQLAAIGDGMEIEVERLGVGEQKRRDAFGPTGQKRLLMGAKAAIGIIGREGFFGEDIEAGEEPEGGVEVEIVDIAASFFVEELEDEEAEQGAARRNHFRTRIARLLAEPIETEFGEEREKEKQAGDRSAQVFFGGGVEDAAIGDGRNEWPRRGLAVDCVMGTCACRYGEKGGVCPARIWL